MVGDKLDDGAKRELRTLPLLEVYRQWFAPMAERPGGGAEVNCSCFNTDFHVNGDEHPQFGINTDLNTYYCHACGVRGDIIDLAANYLGLADATTDYRCPDAKVHEVVKYAGETLCGWSFRKTPAGWQRIPALSTLTGTVNVVDAPVLAVAPPAATLGAAHPEQAPAVSSAVSRSGVRLGRFTPPNAPVMPTTTPGFSAPEYTGERAPLVVPDEDVEAARIAAANFSLDWRDFVPADTPLRNYLEITCRDTSPEEFHFWNFMSIIGLAMGRKVYLPDDKNVYGNSLLCLVGRTGQGKSKSESYANELIRMAMPFDDDDHLTNGVRVVKNPGSGEFLASNFLHEVEDPTFVPGRGIKKPPRLVNPSVKALIRWPEMATMVGKASARGSIVQTTVIDLYDNPDTIGGGSLTHGSYGAKNPFGSVTTTTQLAAVRHLLTGDQAASGFLNRWWFVIGRSKPFQPWGTHINVAPVKHDVEMLVKWAEDKFRNVGGYHKLSAEAFEAASEFLVRRCHPLEADENDEMLRRAVLTFKKLILLFSANMMEDEVSIAAVDQAKIAFEYLIDCMRHIGVQIGQSDFEVFFGHTTEIIQQSGIDGITPSELRKKIRRRMTGVNVETVNKWLDTAEKAGMIELVLTPTPGRGRAQKRYHLSGD